jgi:2-dehydro-3-deoxyphosphogluconate aldolase/(4S)-4-hydroxy-2-oxoglutarate aldolase
MTIIETGNVIGIVRYRERCDLRAVLEALTGGGIVIVEVTLDTPGALDAIARMARSGKVVGAGTVLKADQVRASADVGARFVVSPGIIEDVIETALALGMEPFPGILSPTELLHAQRLGVSGVKVFPAGPAGGPGLIAALHAPFPETALVPTGGIDVDDVSAYVDAGASAVGLGSALVGRRPPRHGRELDAVRERAAAAVEAATR